MATFSALGIGSGLDLSTLLEGLMGVERKPLTAMQNQVTSYNTKISALGTLSDKLGALQTAAQALKPATLQSASEKFASYSGSLADDTVGKVSVGAGAAAGSYTLKVTSLAAGQKDISNVATGGKLETGTFEISFGTGNERNVSIGTSAGETLETLRDTINSHTAKSGVTASIINGADGKRLVLNGAEGTDNAFTAGGGGVVFNGDFATVAASNAEIELDGVKITSQSNKIADVLSGVTLDLAADSKDKSTTLTITRNTESKLKSSLEAFVKAYNNATSSIASLGAYNAETKVAGDLQGNSILRNAQNTLRSLVFNTNGGDLKLSGSNDALTLSSIGVSIGKDGALALDAEKLAAAVAKDPDVIANFAAKVGAAFDKEIEYFTGTMGSIQISKDSLNSSIRDLEERQEALTSRLQKVEERYRAQFSALDVLLSSLNTTSSYLTQTLASLPSSSSSSSKN
ncbi:MAG: flagellar filament capping protein FliD [Zoogloeaceae bacterium]|jgi:flagellar hook-associated protein 2|nr:flagellar filament capping protein FliD [Zoogloeaceae bacterium]